MTTRNDVALYRHSPPETSLRRKFTRRDPVRRGLPVRPALSAAGGLGCQFQCQFVRHGPFVLTASQVVGQAADMVEQHRQRGRGGRPVSGFSGPWAGAVAMLWSPGRMHNGGIDIAVAEICCGTRQIDASAASCARHDARLGADRRCLRI